jgi:hypothetical protein
MHVIRVCTGLVVIAWLLLLAGHRGAFFGLDGWVDGKAYRELAWLPEETSFPLGWSLLFWCGNNAALLTATYIVSLSILILFTLGIAVRLTAVVTWVIVVSFTVNPATHYDADTLLVVLAFYLMIGYLFYDDVQKVCTQPRMKPHGPWLQWPGPFRKRRSCDRDALAKGSLSANIALRLLQIHFAMVVVTSGLHKLQSGDWWAGVALWYPLFPPPSAAIDDVRQHADHAVSLLFCLSTAAYACLGWQIAFPVFAWKRRWRLVLLGGALAGWIGNTWLYQLPVFGSAMFIGCLSYIQPAEWNWARTRFERFAIRNSSRPV